MNLELGNVTLFWTYQGPQTGMFRIYMGERPCCLKRFVEVVPERRGEYFVYVDKGAKPGERLCYKVVPLSPAGEFGRPSPVFCFNYTYIPPPPAVREAREMRGGVLIRWTPRENVQGYNVYMISPKGMVRLNRVLIRGDSFSREVAPGVYRLCVASVYVERGIRYEGPCSKPFTVRVSRLLPPPPPKDVSAVPYQGGIFITWSPGGSGEYYYQVYRSEDGEHFEKIAETTKIFFLDKSVKKGKTYYYKVRAFYRNVKFEGSLFSKVVKVSLK